MSYGKFGDGVHLDEESFNKATQLLWDYLHLRLRERNYQKFHWQKVGMRKRIFTKRLIRKPFRGTLQVIHEIQLPVLELAA